MFPASFTMFPLATTPALHATLLSVERDVVLGVLVGAMVLLGSLLAHNAHRAHTSRASRPRIVLRHRAL